MKKLAVYFDPLESYFVFHINQDQINTPSNKLIYFSIYADS